MNKNICKFIGFVLLTTVTCFCCQRLPAQDDLPKAEQVIEKHIKATGGQKAYDQIKNRIVKADLEMKNVGLKLGITMYSARPNKLLTIAQAEAIGKIEEGCDGKIVWSNSEIQGPVIVKGVAREMRLRDVTFERIVYWKKTFKSVKNLGIEKADGKECYKIEFTPKDLPKQDDASEIKPKPFFVYFDKESYLNVKTTGTIVSEAGEIEGTATMSDYRKVDGIMIPFTLKMEILGQNRVITVKSVEHNAKLGDDRFTPPQDVLDLIKKNDKD